MTIKLAIVSEIERVAAVQQRKLSSLSDDLVLLDSGLGSLCFAILVAWLEDSLGVDPFTASNDVTFPVTLGEFVQAYQNAAR